MTQPKHETTGLTEVPSYKLPTTVVPSHYKIHQVPNFRTFMCRGEVEIDVDVREATRSITLHARDLIITSAYVLHENGTRLNAITVPATVKLTDPTTGKQHEKKFKSAASLDEATERATFTLTWPPRGTAAPSPAFAALTKER